MGIGILSAFSGVLGVDAALRDPLSGTSRAGC